MSFLVEDDQQATLEVALAFIEACDNVPDSLKSVASPQQSSPSASTTSNDDGLDHLDLSTPELLFDQPATLFPEPIRTTVSETNASATTNGQASSLESGSSKARRNADAVRRLRARKKAEGAYLRDQVIELEAKLRQLQFARLAKNPLHALLQLEDEESELNAEEKEKEGHLTHKLKTVSVWREIASIQAKERRKSEVLNVKLREAIKKQMKTRALLESLLRKKSNLQGLELLWKDQQEHLYNDSLLTKEKMFFEELREDIGEMYRMTAKLFERSPDFDVGNMTCTTQVKQDPMFGSFIEVRTSAPLRGGITDAGELVWQQTLCNTTVLSSVKYYTQKRNVTNSSFQKSYILTIDGPTGPVELHGISYVQRVDEPHRFVYMWTSRILLASGKASVFHERGWMLASKVDGHAKYPAMFQTCYRVAGSDPHQVLYPLGSVTEELKEAVLDALTMRTREYHQSVQNMLIDELARFTIRRPLAVTA
uniref:BZIP domain-containing protein n=1 Tax=Globisporangium ultimum (strain ATCC 200006 / CBS 805.95 / DAOM BR144) TaxID=431595 RepID=K3W8Q7_GLOUD